MPKTLVSLAALFTILVLCPNGALGQKITLKQELTVDQGADFKVIPRSFCRIDSGLFAFTTSRPDR